MKIIGSAVESEPIAESPRVVRIEEVAVVIPTLNAETHWPELQDSLALQGIPADQILIIDSSSSDKTRELAKTAGYRAACFAREDFTHGGTRQLALDLMPYARIFLYMTQDAVLADPNSVRTLCDILNLPKVGAAYGRQQPRLHAGAIESHARLYNYPAVSQVRCLEDKATLGIKTAFFSNSFAVYRREALEAVGGFPSDVIIAEDSITAAHMLMAGWKVAYCAEAVVIHSHGYSILEEFSRYFDTGVLHSREDWLLEVFGNAGSEGKRFVSSEMRYLLRNAPLQIPNAMLRTFVKFLAYRLGRAESAFPKGLNKSFSGHAAWWDEVANR